ncbi:hypothetical protein FRC04_001231 [Tulasnella sp. 424]|nr:hypothetical protein FRC04_001231 [Tulasnella sp. 424]KAG8969601.1 hypothetical protein FRC05_001032 [Tulasnella sp. 425]
MPLFTKDTRRKLFENVSLDLQAACLEFCGTFVFLLFGLGGLQAVNYQSVLELSQSGQSAGQVTAPMNIIQLLYGSAVLGLSLLFSVWLFYRVTGGIFNPNVTTALLLTGVVGPMVAAIAASAVLLALLPGPLSFNTAPGPGISKSQATFIEMFVTAALILSVLMLAAEKHRSTSFAPVGIGLTLFACELFSLSFTGGSLNTARSFGPAVVTGFNASHWVYWLGPFLGTLLAVAMYSILKHVEYWNINPGQDSVDKTQSPSGPIDTIRGMTSHSTRYSDGKGKGLGQNAAAVDPEDYPTGTGPRGYEASGRLSEGTAV